VITPFPVRVRPYSADGFQQRQRGSIHGFSHGLMSIARPFACGDAHCDEFDSDGFRQLYADVLSAVIDLLSQPPYASIGIILRMGNPTRYSSAITFDKLVVVSLLPNEFSIADPNDSGMLDCVGFSTDTPVVMSDFIKG
jgi:hypothetical protein